MLAKFFSKKRVLITGHTGFKGSWLAQMLVSMGADVSGFALEPNTDPNLYSLLSLDSRLSSRIADIRHYGDVLSVIEEEKPEIVFHLAAQPLVRASYDDPRYTFETNAMGTVNVLEAIRRTSCVRSAVLITTDKVYENKEDGKPFAEGDALGGHDPYSASKAAGEIAISSYIRSFFNPSPGGEKPSRPGAGEKPVASGSAARAARPLAASPGLGGKGAASGAVPSLPLIASARAGNVIGGGDWSADRLVPDIIRAKASGQALVLRNPSSIRPWQHVLDPLYGYLLLAKGLGGGDRPLVGAYNFAPDESKPITVEQIARKAGVKYSVQPDGKKHEAGTLMLDAGKARKMLGWKPRLDLDESLQLTFEWYSRHAAGEDMLKFTQKQIDDYLRKAEK
ncbi:MAG: GDP-mannose 4,6-dehydratase [Candidatus Micrarchaeota archaeon]